MSPPYMQPAVTRATLCLQSYHRPQQTIIDYDGARARSGCRKPVAGSLGKRKPEVRK